MHADSRLPGACRLSMHSRCPLPATIDRIATTTTTINIIATTTIYIITTTITTINIIAITTINRIATPRRGNIVWPTEDVIHRVYRACCRYVGM